MCGILGAYGKCSTNLEEPLRLLAHRGPDGQVIQSLSRGALAHARLSIVDLQGGRQPMSDFTEKHWLVCNGEIYNHQTVRAGLRAYPFKTRSDSEVILALYENYGPAGIVSRLDGMYAFALLAEGELVLARDPLGIKPLYYGWDGDTLYFASEIKALQGQVESVYEFPPGCWYSTAAGFVQYYDVSAFADTPPPVSTTRPLLSDIQASLEGAVRKRLMADVPLGIFLSGGLDSSIIAALVRDSLESVHSFAVGIEDSSDLHFARQAAAFLGTQHHECVYTPREMVKALPDVIYYLESFDPALVRSAIPNYFLARLASDYVTVVLAGEGADELYAGYSYLRPFGNGKKLHQELVEITEELHNRNLQRLDRMTMAHGLEGRVPFLDAEFVELSFSIPTELKVYGSEAVEKWVLREAFEEFLPPEIIWRTKQKFSQGAGSAFFFEQLAESEINDHQFAHDVAQVFLETGHTIRSKEELYYYRIFRRFFSASVTALVGHSRSL